jgi:ubiquinone/menaquinone biosynthesis C-methylase UbiE
MNQLMQYIETVPELAPQNGSRKFTGEVASGYDKKREESPKWQIEQQIIEGMLDDLPPDTLVLDIPVGTGRFLDFYTRKGLIIHGMDISEEMMAEAAKKVDPKQARGELRVGNILATNLPDKSVDVAVNCRITRWIMGDHGPDGIRQMLREMQRVTRNRIILTARVDHHKFAVTLDLIQSALDGWAITQNIAGVDLDYRILMLEPV